MPQKYRCVIGTDECIHSYIQSVTLKETSESISLVFCRFCGMNHLVGEEELKTSNERACEKVF